MQPCSSAAKTPVARRTYAVQGASLRLLDGQICRHDDLADIADAAAAAGLQPEEAQLPRQERIVKVAVPTAASGDVQAVRPTPRRHSTRSISWTRSVGQ